jgi:putative transposase
MAGQMRAISETAVKTTRKARRDAERRPATPRPRAPALPPGPGDGATPAAVPFGVIEEW